jgi:hypothetical protein
VLSDVKYIVGPSCLPCIGTRATDRSGSLATVIQRNVLARAAGRESLPLLPRIVSLPSPPSKCFSPSVSRVTVVPLPHHQ